jgi:outer membrane protein, heavy metal efflux system
VIAQWPSASTPKTPTVCRTFVVASLLVFCGVAKAETLTETDVIRMARAQDPQVLAARESTLVAEAHEVRASLYPNPSLGWDREHLPTGAPASEDSYFLTVPIEFTGRRPAQSALARSGTSSARARAAQTQSDAVTRSLDAFYAALATEREVEILARTLARLEEAARVVGRRYEEGTTSGYERTRLEVEADLARSQLRQAEARSRTARATLAALLGADGATLQLRGDFTTTDPAETTEPRERPSIRLFRAAEAEVRTAEEAASWAWVPTLSLSGGLRVGQTTETRFGYVAGVLLSLPVFSRGQELVAESAAGGRLAAAAVRVAERETRIEAVRAREQFVSARAESVRFTESTRDRIEMLERAALSGYREGDRSVVELVDAQRARTEVDRRCLELEVLAKQAELDLRAARGEFE